MILTERVGAESLRLISDHLFIFSDFWEKEKDNKIMEAQQVSLIPDQLDHWYGWDNLGLQLGLCLLYLSIKLPTPKHRYLGSKGSALLEGAARHALEREGRLDHESHPISQSQGPDRTGEVGRDWVRVIEGRVEVTFPLFFFLGVRCCFLK